MEPQYLLTEQPIEIYRSANGQEFWRGYAAVWHDPKDPGTEYKMSEWSREHIARDAFDVALRSGKEIELRFDHDEHSVMDSTKQSLVLATDNKGLRYEAPYDAADPDHQKAKAKLAKGLLRGSSFGFDTRQTKYNITRDGANKYVRTLQDIALFEVSLTYKPAYKNASTTIRKELDDFERAEEIRKRAAKYLAPSGIGPSAVAPNPQGIDGNQNRSSEK